MVSSPIAKIFAFQHTAARRRLRRLQMRRRLYRCFNTQPPEGGCLYRPGAGLAPPKFQHTAARRRLPRADMAAPDAVSTHSRPKAAAMTAALARASWAAFQHTAARRRLPATITTQTIAVMFQHTAARRRLPRARALMPSKARFNTQPPEGGCMSRWINKAAGQSFNTQPPEGGCSLLENSLKIRQLEATFR